MYSRIIEELLPVEGYLYFGLKQQTDIIWMFLIIGVVTGFREYLFIENFREQRVIFHFIIGSGVWSCTRNAILKGER